MTPFVIVALVYVVFVGGTGSVSEPLRFVAKGSYASLEACQEGLKSDKVQADKVLLDKFVRSQLDKDEDGGEHGLAITMSCEEDKHV